VIVQVAIGLAVIAVAAGVAWWLRRRETVGPVRDAYPVPRQVSRADFARADAPWLVAYFSSATCASCAGLGPKVAVLESREVATCEVSFESRRALHDRYRIDAIPMVLIVDARGVVCRAFVGATTATDLWAAVAEVRFPGSTPEAELGAVF
jgi:hypothetical protein